MRGTLSCWSGGRSRGSSRAACLTRHCHSATAHSRASVLPARQGRAVTDQHPHRLHTAGPSVLAGPVSRALKGQQHPLLPPQRAIQARPSLGPPLCFCCFALLLTTLLLHRPCHQLSAAPCTPLSHPQPAAACAGWQQSRQSLLAWTMSLTEVSDLPGRLGNAWQRLLQGNPTCASGTLQ